MENIEEKTQRKVNHTNSPCPTGEVSILTDTNFTFIIVTTAAGNLSLLTGRTETGLEFGLKPETGWTSLQL
jgi:hypothetical protein